MPQLDELRDLARGGKEWIARYQAEEIERTGIPNLKVGFNNVFGYYLEVHRRPGRQSARGLHPQADAEKPGTVHHAGAERTRRQGAAGRGVRRFTLEQELFVALRERVARQAPRLQEDGRDAGAIDVLVGLAMLAVNARLLPAGD